MRFHVARHQVTRWLPKGAGVLQLGVVASCLCCAGTVRVAGLLRPYGILVPGRDSISTQVAGAFSRRGFRVRPAVQGGSRPTLAYVSFWFGEPGLSRPMLYYARLADTRTGAILAAAAVSLDSLGPDLRSRADSLVALLTAPLPGAP
jgi:hypothetical protein